MPYKAGNCCYFIKYLGIHQAADKRDSKFADSTLPSFHALVYCTLPRFDD